MKKNLNFGPLQHESEPWDLSMPCFIDCFVNGVVDGKHGQIRLVRVYGRNVKDLQKLAQSLQRSLERNQDMLRELSYDPSTGEVAF